MRTRPGYLATWVRRGQEGGGKERRGARERLVMSGLARGHQGSCGRFPKVRFLTDPRLRATFFAFSHPKGVKNVVPPYFLASNTDRKRAFNWPWPWRDDELNINPPTPFQ